MNELTATNIRSSLIDTKLIGTNVCVISTIYGGYQLDINSDFIFSISVKTKLISSL